MRPTQESKGTTPHQDIEENQLDYRMKAKELFEQNAKSCYLVGIEGNGESIIEGIAAFESSGPKDLVVVPSKKAFENLNGKKFAAIVIPKDLMEDAKSLPKNVAVIVSAAIELSHALLKQKLGDHDYSIADWGRIHPSAVIHESVKIPESTSIGPKAIVEKGAVIGENCRIMSNVVIEHFAIIGDNVTVHPGAIIGWECVIGENGIIGSNSVVGGEGFGFSQDQEFNHHRIPHTGNVKVGKKVRVGASSTIDRGTYGSTTIGDGTIIDNMCHIAHNVTIGKNCIICGGFLCAGSCVLGDRVVASGGTMLKDHVNICSDVYLMHRAGVINDIKAPVLPAVLFISSRNCFIETIMPLRFSKSSLPAKS